MVIEMKIIVQGMVYQLVMVTNGWLYTEPFKVSLIQNKLTILLTYPAPSIQKIF